MTDKNHYQVLGVSPTAGYLEIKKSYRALAKELHPDRLQNPTENDQARFAEVAEAYRVLSNLQLRKAYDAALNPPKQQTPPPDRQFYQPHYSGYPYFQLDFVTPYLHSFFMGQNTATVPREEHNQKLLFNYKTLAVAIFGALFFFKFFTSMEGVVTHKNIEERLFNNISYTVILKTDENKTQRKRIKVELYDLVNVEDQLRKSMFSLTYYINDEEVEGPSTERFFLQMTMIYAVITGGLFLLDLSRRKQRAENGQSRQYGAGPESGPDEKLK